MRHAALLACAALAGLAACATATGPYAARSFDRYEAAAPVDFRAYEAVHVPPVTASTDILARVGAQPIGPRSRIRPLGEDDVEDQTTRLREHIVRALSETARIADAPGPGVLTVEAELTELDANRPTMAEMRQFPAVDPRSVSVGDAAARVTLSEDGRTLAVIEDRALRANLNDPGIGVGWWVTANRFYDRFSDKLAALLA